jgi:hypothetical protein|tara:strand:+ start:231 stop:671 length:441 start_codon:yes stop_codon:yes gene_type:complete
MKKKKHKYFPYGIIKQPPISGWSPTNRKNPIRFNSYEKKQKSWPYILGIIFLLILMHFIGGCSHTPIVDSRGKSSANIEGDMERYHDDLYTCKDIADDHTNSVTNASKKVYNAFRWRVLWLSPKLKTKDDLVNNCLEGRGYSVLNK